jgi:CRISPR type I-E-associated protein CasB/Cse2
MSAPDRAADWWRQTKDNRATMAKLRRARSPLEALAVDGFMGLHRRLGGGAEKAVRHAELARVLAHLTKEGHESLPSILGRQNSKDAPRVFSDLRMRRLLQIEPSETAELARALIRIVRMTKGKGDANPRDLAAAMLYWGDRIKTDWAYAYFGETPPAEAEPTQTEIQTEDAK